MEISDLTQCIPIAVTFLAGANLAEYTKTTEWLKKHGNVNPDWYEERERTEKTGFLKKMDYYLLLAGRKLAYRDYAEHKKSKR